MKNEIARRAALLVGLVLQIGEYRSLMASQPEQPPQGFAQLASLPSETRALMTSGQFRTLDQRISAIQAAYDKGAITDEELRAALRAELRAAWG